MYMYVCVCVERERELERKRERETQMNELFRIKAAIQAKYIDIYIYVCMYVVYIYISG